MITENRVEDVTEEIEIVEVELSPRPMSKKKKKKKEKNAIKKVLTDSELLAIKTQNLDAMENAANAIRKTKPRRVYYDVKTKNPSFIKMVNVLKELGIKNYKFPLTLYDPKLCGVDPYDPNLSQEMQARIINEVRINFWYFMREVARIPVPGRHKPYELHRGNLALSWCLVNNINCIIELPRQNGKSISLVVFYLWLYNFGTSNSELMLMNKKFSDSKLNLKRIKELREVLPFYLQFIDKEDKNNTEVMISEISRNSLVAKPAAQSAVAADGLGRGCTQPCQWYDEFAFLKWNDIIYA